MKWWVWAIIIILVISGVFWLYVFLTKDKAKNDSLIKAREAKSEKAAVVEKNTASELIEDIKADAGTT